VGSAWPIEVPVRLEVREVLMEVLMVGTGVGVPSGSPNQTGEQSTGGWFEVKLTSDAYHSSFVICLINEQLRVQCRHDYVHRW
jgi:hypothetical protein